jgi:hypothetical protein
MSERLDRAVLTARRCGRLPLLLRGVIALGVAGAVVATALPGWDVPDVYLMIAVVAGAVGVVVPDAGGAVFCTLAVIVAWATGATDVGVGPAVVVTALCLLLVHVATALAAAMPVTAHGPTRLVLRWARPTGVLAAATVATAGLTAALDRWSPPGSLLLVLAALAVLAVGTWWLTTGGSR